jgi:PAS domain S-box-containing protein
MPASRESSVSTSPSRRVRKAARPGARKSHGDDDSVGKVRVEAEPAHTLVVEAVQAECDRRYRVLVEQSPDAIVVHDERGRLLYANSMALSMTAKRSIEDIRGTDIFAYLPRDQHDTIRRGIRQVLDGEPVTPISIPVPLPDGRIIQVEVNAGLVEYNGCRAVQAVLRDVTVRKKMESALRESEERNRTLVEMSPDGIIIHQDGRIVYANPAAIQLLRAVDEHDLVGREILSIVRPDYRTPVQQSYQLDLEGATTPPVDVFLRCCDGTTTAVEGRGARIVMNDRPAVQVHLRDITERKKIEMRLKEYAEKLKRSNEDLGRFAYVSSHDLQEPLRTVVSFTQLLKRRYHGQFDADADDYIQFIVEAGSRMPLLINDLLDFSRVTTKGCELRRIESEIVLEQTLAGLYATIEETGSIVTQGPLPQVMADAIQLRRSFRT